MEKKAICTIVSLNYFAHAVNLAESVKNYHNDVERYVLIVDVVPDNELENMKLKYGDFIHIILVSEIGIKNFHSMAFKYDIVEFNTAVKPYFMDYLFEKYNFENIMYIDSDILLFHKMDKVYHLLKEYSIILTPHLISSEEDSDTKMSKIDDFLQYGVYNLGYIAVKNDKIGRSLLHWWKEKLSSKCFLEPKQFQAWDQKWMDFVPALFDSVYIIKDPGYNVAFWNIQNRYISKKDNIFYVNDKYKLVFYHFSHHKLSKKDKIASLEQEKRCVSISERSDLIEIFETYQKKLMLKKYEYYNKLTYGYAYYSNGEKIKKQHRRLYNKLIMDKKNVFKNPFDSNSEESFYHYINYKIFC